MPSASGRSPFSREQVPMCHHPPLLLSSSTHSFAGQRSKHLHALDTHLAQAFFICLGNSQKKTFFSQTLTLPQDALVLQRIAYAAM